MARNTYKLSSNTSVAQATRPVQGGDVLLQDQYGTRYPLRMGAPIIVADLAAFKSAASISTGSVYSNPRNAFADGDNLYLVNSGEVRVFSLTSMTQLGLLSFGGCSYPEANAVTRLSATLGAVIYKPSTASITLRTFSLTNGAAVGATVTVPHDWVHLGASLCLASYQGQAVVAVTELTSTAKFRIRVYAFSAAGIGALLHTSADIAVGDNSRAWLLPLGDGSRMLLWSGNRLSIYDLGTQTLIHDTTCALTLGAMADSYTVGGDVYLAGFASYTFALLKVSATGVVSTVASQSIAEFSSATLDGDCSRVLSYGATRYLVRGQRSVRGGKLGLLAFDDSGVVLGRLVRSNTPSSSCDTDLQCAGLDDNGLMTVWLKCYDGANYYYHAYAFDVSQPATMVERGSFSPFANIGSGALPSRMALDRGSYLYFWGYSSTLHKLNGPSRSPQGVALTGAAAGESVVVLKNGISNTAVTHLKAVTGSYDGAIAGITPAGKKLTFNSGKITVE